MTPAPYDAQRVDGNHRAAVGPACQRLRQTLLRETLSPRDSGPILFPRDTFTKHLVDKLQDPGIHEITLVTYTGEVDGLLFDRFHVRGPKAITLFKRSILADFAEQQRHNLDCLARGVKHRPWAKRLKSFDVSERMGRELPRDTSLTQFLYDAPPSRRAYIFNDFSEAIVAYYEVVEGGSNADFDGSVYQGITASEALIVKRDSRHGRFVLDELRNFVRGLMRVSRLWQDERAELLGNTTLAGSRYPCLSPSAVFFDLDGVLYDSLPLYVIAWQEAFSGEEVGITEFDIHRGEGLPGQKLVREIFERAGGNPSDDHIGRILQKRNATLERLGPAPLMAGASELVRAVRSSGLTPWVVTSSRRKRQLDALALDFPEAFPADRIVTGQDCKNLKPDPEPYLLACSRARVRPASGIAIENAPLGLQAARAAGLVCVAVNTGKLDDEDLRSCGAWAIFRGCADLASRWNGVVDLLRQ
jgi:HAD superfamily hydrolase (TIGR01509 family)